MVEKANSIIDRFKSPALWITLLASLFWISVRLNNVDVIGDRLDKKIAVQNEHQEEIHELKLEIVRLEGDIKVLKKEMELIHDE